jgi:hypothetical protein
VIDERGRESNLQTALPGDERARRYRRRVVFKQIWKRVDDNDAAAPNPKDLHRSVREVLIAAVIQGAFFGLVKAAVDRAGATGYRALTHEDPV